jgi:tripartite-type tricarboxylate transporter receptor subunit TctC
MKRNGLLFTLWLSVAVFFSGIAGQARGRPMMVTPGTPPERVKLLREAYMKVLNNTTIRNQAKKGRVDIEPTSGEELETLVKDIFDAPPDVIKRAK